MGRTNDFLKLALGFVLVLPGAVVAQSSSSFFASAGPVAGGAPVVNPVHQEVKPFEVGALVQGGVGLSENRGSFRFFMAGVHAGKVLTGNFGPGVLHGNFEYAVEAFPFWRSYTPTFQRQTCTSITGPLGVQQASCSVPYTVGGTFTGVSVTPAILRWNFAGSRHISPWIQGAGGVIWTNHKYPAVGGPPVSTGGITNSSIGNNGANNNASVWNFTPQFGVGAHYFLRAHRSIDIGANAIHVSSASLGDKNPGVNASVQFTVGYSWWK
ncbi:MAG TPA: acyloxyacyl hydrolase [Acidobacteriaceae bacterium]